VRRGARAFVVACTCAAIISCAEGAAVIERRDVETGRRLYAANGCATCHGTSGRGDGRLAATLTPRPRDFTDTGSFKRSRTSDALADVVATGGPGTPSSMPAYPHFTETERRQLALYVLSLGDRSTARPSR
jgi:high-affinity iron transporter